MYHPRVYRGKTVFNKYEMEKAPSKKKTYKKSKMIQIVNPLEVFGEPPKVGSIHSSTMTDIYKEVL